MEGQLSEGRSLVGHWWLPGSGREVPGTLRVSASEGVQLELIGSLEESDEQEPPSPPLWRDYPVVIGRAEGAPRVTLENCHQHSLGVGGVVTQSLYADRMYDGVHFTDPTEATFTGASLTLDRLSDWAGQPGFLGPSDRPGMEDLDAVIAFKAPDPIEFRLPGASLSIWTGASSRLGWYEESVAQVTSFEFEALEPLHFETWRDAYFSRLHDLLDFATDRACGVRDMRLHDTEGEPMKRRRVTVAHRLIDTAHDDLSRPLLPHEILFTLSSATKVVPSIVENWFSLRERLGYAGDLLFSTLYREGTILDNYFWNVAQAAEISHREVFGLDGAGNTRDIYFIDRMRELVASSNGTVAAVVPNTEGFVTRVRDTRNYITHGNPRQEKRSVRDADLYYLAHQIAFVLKANILLGLGFDDSGVKTMLERNQRFATLRYLLAIGRVQA